MEFGKVSDIGAVDFSLPEDMPFDVGGRVGATALGRPAFYVGCTGWAMPEWVGTVYPKGAKSKDYLRHYAAQFNTIELNTTHYRIPTADLIARWCAEAADDFRFCPKVPQRISHSRDLGLGTDQITLFCDAISGLGDRLGCCFIQLPPYFGIDRQGALAAFLDKFPSYIPLAVEVRHESWFADAGAVAVLRELLAAYGRSSVITDVAGRRDVLAVGAIGHTAMIRFVGNGLHATDYERIDAWVLRLHQWFEAGLERVYFFTHQPDNLLAPQMADYLAERVRALGVAQVRGPRLDGQVGKGGQMSLF